MTPEEQAALDSEARVVEGDVITAAEQAAGAGPGTAAEEPPGPSTADLIAAITKPIFDVLAPAWGVTEDECKMLGIGTAPAIDKWFGGLNLGVEVTAAVTVLAIFGPRIGKPRKFDESKQADEMASAPREG